MQVISSFSPSLPQFVPNDDFNQILLKCVQEISQHLRVALAPPNNPHIGMMRSLLEITMQLRIAQNYTNVVMLLQKVYPILLNRATCDIVQFAYIYVIHAVEDCMCYIHVNVHSTLALKGIPIHKTYIHKSGRLDTQLVRWWVNTNSLHKPSVQTNMYMWLMGWVSFYVFLKIPVWLVCYSHGFHVRVPCNVVECYLQLHTIYWLNQHVPCPPVQNTSLCVVVTGGTVGGYEPTSQ